MDTVHVPEMSSSIPAACYFPAPGYYPWHPDLNRLVPTNPYPIFPPLTPINPLPAVMPLVWPGVQVEPPAPREAKRPFRDRCGLRLKTGRSMKRNAKQP